MQTAAIIGSNGFIGRHLTERLRRRADLKLLLFGKGEHSLFGAELPYGRIDFNDRAALQKSFAGVDVVYYLVSETIPASSWQNPLLEVEMNLMPFIRFLEAICNGSVKKVVFVSSAGTVYGPSNQKVTEDSDKRPFSPYGITKLTMEHFLQHYQVKCGLQYDVYRVSNVYGEGQNTGKGLGIINTFLEKIIVENEVRIFGDGKAVRNYIYVGDVAELLCRSLISPGSSEIYNVSSHNTISINELVEVIRSVVAENFKVSYQETRQSDNSAIYLDNSKISKAYPDFSFLKLEEGIARTYAHIKEKQQLNNH